jgi:RimJ/RimL family protein N-acetyltransferase
VPYPEEETTARLTLRRWTPEDAAAQAAIWSDPEVWTALRSRETDDPRKAAARSLARHLAHWEKHGFGLWAVVPRGEDEPVGWAGAWYPHFVPELRGEMEIGWTLRRDYRGRGLATEAARRAVATAFEHLGPDRVISLIAPTNQPSASVAARLGMRRAGATTSDHEIALDVYELARPANERISPDTNSGSAGAALPARSRPFADGR